jgi:hypothetical protein
LDAHDGGLDAIDAGSTQSLWKQRGALRAPFLKARFFGREVSLPHANINGPLATLECHEDSIVLEFWFRFLEKIVVPLDDIDTVELNPRWPFRAFGVTGDSIRILHHGNAPSPISFYSRSLRQLADILERRGVRVVRSESRVDATRS